MDDELCRRWSSWYLYCGLVSPGELNQNLAVVGEIPDWLAILKSWPLANIGVATLQSTDEFVLGLSKIKLITPDYRPRNDVPTPAQAAWAVHNYHSGRSPGCKIIVSDFGALGNNDRLGVMNRKCMTRLGI